MPNTTMPIVKRFEIKLDKPQRQVYSAGDDVKGHCLLNIDGELRLKNLDIRLICEGCVDYKENKSYNKTVRFLSEKYDLLKMAGTDQTIRGIIKIDFVFTLPVENIPSSFEGKYGYIRYKIEADIHKDWDSFRKEIGISVIAPFNGSLRELNLQIIRSVTKNLFIGDQYIKLYAKINKKWFLPGEVIPIYCHIDHSTKKLLKISVSLHLKQNYFFATKFKSKISGEELVDYVNPLDNIYSNVMSFMVTKNLKTMSFKSAIIEVSYELRIAVEIVDSRDKITMDLPVIITFKPNTVRNSNSTPVSPSFSDCHIFHRSASEDIYFPFSGALAVMNNSYRLNVPTFVDLPPSYEEAVFGISSLNVR